MLIFIFTFRVINIIIMDCYFTWGFKEHIIFIVIIIKDYIVIIIIKILNFTYSSCYYYCIDSSTFFYKINIIYCFFK